MNINSDNTPETTTGMEIIARDLPSYDEGLQDVASLPFGNGTGAEDEERLPADQPRTYFSRTNKIIFGVLGGCLVVFVTAISSAAVASSNIAKSFNSSPTAPKSSKAPKSTKQPTATKQPKTKVVKVKVKGSPDPVGTDGPTKLTPACLADGGLCQADFANGGYNSDGCQKYLKCLRKKDNGPVLVGDWWLQRDVSNGEMFFEDEAVCGAISTDAANSRTRFELWNDSELGKGLGLFNKFTVDYDFRSIGSGGSGGYLNFYIRASDNSDYYNCNFVYNIPNVVGTGTLEVFPDTVPNSVRASGSDTNGCSGTPSILDYLSDNPNAVMGVGNGELYTFVLNTGSTGQNNDGKEICWSNASVERYDDKGNIRVTTYEFTTL